MPARSDGTQERGHLARQKWQNTNAERVQIMTERYLAQRIQGMGTTIFTEMSRLAIELDAVNLGQGFPDFPGPDNVKEAARQAIADDINQYERGHGRLSLCEAIAEHSARFYDMDVDPINEVTVTQGATEGIFASILGLVDPGDEIIVFEPFYDSYLPAIEMAGGTARIVTLRPPAFTFDAEELRTLVGPKTKAIIVNTPNNPSGHVYTREELSIIADLCRDHDLIAVTDEVYEHIVFEGHEHVRLATLPGMWDRTITVSSAGKTFSLTGWKIGWAIAPSHLTPAVRRTHQFMTFSIAPPLQEAVAVGLSFDDEYYETVACEYEERRDYLVDVLNEAGLSAYTPQGTYFVLADIRPAGFDNDVAFCRHLVEAVGVAAIPPSAFYVNKSEGNFLARFAFCKRWETLEAAADRLQRL